METKENYAVCSKIALMFDVKPFTNLVPPKKKPATQLCNYLQHANKHKNQQNVKLMYKWEYRKIYVKKRGENSNKKKQGRLTLFYIQCPKLLNEIWFISKINQE